MVQISLDEAKRELDHLLEEVGKGEEIIITKDNAPLARLSSLSPLNRLVQGAGRLNRQPGSAKEIVLYISDDFDAPLDDFQE